METRQPLGRLKPGSEVAVMPVDARSPDDVLDILTVAVAGLAITSLSNGGVYYSQDGGGVNTFDYITPATDAHYEALLRKRGEAKLNGG